MKRNGRTNRVKCAIVGPRGFMGATLATALANPALSRQFGLEAIVTSNTQWDGSFVPRGNLPLPNPPPRLDLNGARKYKDITAMLAGSPDVEAVFVLSPTPHQVAATVAALEAGKHVFVEKPVGLDIAGAQSIADLAANKNLLVQPGLVLRYWWSHLLLLLQNADRGDETLGRLKQVETWRHGDCPGWGAWYADRDQSGGPLLDYGAHDGDVATCWMPSKPLSISATGDAEDYNLCVEHEGGVSVTIKGSWKAGQPFSTGFKVTFEKGEGSWTMGGRFQIGGRTLDSAGSLDPYASQYADFLARVRSARAGAFLDGPTIQHSLRTHGLLAAARIALATGQAQPLNLD